MTDKEKIRAYIERQIALLENNNIGNPVFGVSAGVVKAELKHLLSFIDNLPEEPVSSGLEEATNNYCVNTKECNEVKTLDTKLKSQINKTLSLRISQMEYDKFLEEACQWLSKNTSMTQEEIHSFRKAMKK